MSGPNPSDTVTLHASSQQHSNLALLPPHTRMQCDAFTLGPFPTLLTQRECQPILAGTSIPVPGHNAACLREPFKWEPEANCPFCHALPPAWPCQCAIFNIKGWEAFLWCINLKRINDKILHNMKYRLQEKLSGYRFMGS